MIGNSLSNPMGFRTGYVERRMRFAPARGGACPFAAQDAIIPAGDAKDDEYEAFVRAGGGAGGGRLSDGAIGSIVGGATSALNTTMETILGVIRSNNQVRIAELNNDAAGALAAISGQLGLSQTPQQRQALEEQQQSLVRLMMMLRSPPVPPVQPADNTMMYVMLAAGAAAVLYFATKKETPRANPRRRRRRIR